MARLLSALLVACLLTGGFSAALASGIPSAPLCTVPVRVALCPAGDLVFSATMRDLINNPLADVDTWLEFCAASGWVLASSGQPPAITFPQPCLPTVITDFNGVAAFALKGGGTVSGGIRLLCGGALVRNDLGLASPDQNGDLTVDARDMAILVRKIFAPTLDPTGDLNLDGHVNAGDLAVVMRHLGHHS